MAKTTKASDVLSRVAITLEDEDNTRWPLAELLLYLNDGLREIAIPKPNAVSETVEMALSAGTHQTHDYLALIRVIRNLATVDADPQGRTGGAMIYPVEREAVDASMPGWQDPNIMPFRKAVDNVMQDVADPQSFYVIPGNDGTGVIEAVVARLPADIPTPAQATDINAYSAVIPLHDVWRTVLVNYVLYRAFAKDSADPANAARATNHYNLFAAAVGLKTQSEAVANTQTTRS